MTDSTHGTGRERLMKAATDLFRRQGYAGTSVDDICRAAGVTKGAFFHHFPVKEDLAEACLHAWDGAAREMAARAPWAASDDPVERVLGMMDQYAAMFDSPTALASCLAGTTVQEVSESHPRLREAAHACFVGGEEFLATNLAAAAKSRGVTLDAPAMARLWMAALQGSLLLARAAGEPRQAGETLRHVRHYTATLLAGEGPPSRTSPKRTTRRPATAAKKGRRKP